MKVAIDIGMVCVQLHLEERNAALGFSGELSAPAQKLYDGVENGTISVEEFVEGMSVLTGLPKESVIEGWNLAIGEAVPGMTEAVREFTARGVEFIFLTNTNDLHMAEVRRKCPFAHLVKDAVMSQEVKVCKPDEGIFRAFEEKHGKPDLFFDDLPANVAGARAAGWNAVQFTGADVFRKAIEDVLSR